MFEFEDVSVGDSVSYGVDSSEGWVMKSGKIVDIVGGSNRFFDSCKLQNGDEIFCYQISEVAPGRRGRGML